MSGFPGHASPAATSVKPVVVNWPRVGAELTWWDRLLCRLMRLLWSVLRRRFDHPTKRVFRVAMAVAEGSNGPSGLFMVGFGEDANLFTVHVTLPQYRMLRDGIDASLRRYEELGFSQALDQP